MLALTLTLTANAACDSVTGACEKRTLLVQTGTLPGGGTVNSDELSSLRAAGWKCTDDGPSVSTTGTVLGEQYSCSKC